MPLPNRANWHVVDVPAAVEAGTHNTELHQLPRLSFGDDMRAPSKCDIFDFMRRDPVHGRPAAANSHGPARAAALDHHQQGHGDLRNPILDSAKLRNRDLSLSGFQRERVHEHFTKHGYVIRDRWKAPEFHLKIRFQPQAVVQRGSGYFFERSPEHVRPRRSHRAESQRPRTSGRPNLDRESAIENRAGESAAKNASGSMWTGSSPIDGKCCARRAR